jgi:hypothetical protein
MSALLVEIIDAHGGVARWSGERPIGVALNVSGVLLDRKCFLGRHRGALIIDALAPGAVLRRPGADSNERWIFTPKTVRLRRPTTAP